MFCAKCGAKVAEGVRFCSECGGAMGQGAGTSGVAVQSGGNRKIVVIGVAVLTVVIVAVLVWFNVGRCPLRGTWVYSPNNVAGGQVEHRYTFGRNTLTIQERVRGPNDNSWDIRSLGTHSFVVEGNYLVITFSDELPMGTQRVPFSISGRVLTLNGYPFIRQ